MGGRVVVVGVVHQVQARQRHGFSLSALRLGTWRRQLAAASTVSRLAGEFPSSDANDDERRENDDDESSNARSDDDVHLQTDNIVCSVMRGRHSSSRKSYSNISAKLFLKLGLTKENICSELPCLSLFICFCHPNSLSLKYFQYFIIILLTLHTPHLLAFGFRPCWSEWCEWCEWCEYLLCQHSAEVSSAHACCCCCPQGLWALQAGLVLPRAQTTCLALVCRKAF